MIERSGRDIFIGSNMLRTGGRMRRDTDHEGSAFDVAIVGGGIAGLVSAWHLKPLRCVVLEAEDRPGGRVHSVTGVGGAINMGAHMVPSRDSLVGGIVAELGLATQTLPPTLFGIRHGGRLHLGLPPVALPFALRLSAGERLAFMRLGAKLRLGAWRSVRASLGQAGASVTTQRAAMLDFEGARTLAQYVGPLPPNVDLLFSALTERNGADPAEMSAGHGLRSFANVWAKTAPGLNLVGGTEVLPRTLVAGLGGAVRFGHRVTSVREEPGPCVRVAYRTTAGAGELTARACILATPAPVTLNIAKGLPDGTAQALAAVRYGPFLSLGVSLKGADDLPWRDTYAISTPGLGFSVLFNHDAMRGDTARDGHSLMLFRGASGALQEMQASDDEIIGRWIGELEAAFPQTRGRVCDARLGRWATGAPFAFPGRAALQSALEIDSPPFALAGDYLDFPNMEAAAQAGAQAAEKVGNWLGRAN